MRAQSCPRAHARGRLLAAVVLVWSCLSFPANASTAKLAASGLSFPFFDANGSLTHKVTAKRGTIVGALQHLESVEIEYFAPGDPHRVVQRLIAAEAAWDEKQETLAGRGAITVETEQNRLTGEGFHFAMVSGQLNIQRDFTMTNREVVLTSDRAVVDLVLDRNGDDVKLRDVKRCEAFGNLRVKVRPTATRKYSFEEAQSERAIYDGATHTIEIPGAARLLKKDGILTVNQIDAIVLDPESRPAAQLK